MDLQEMVWSGGGGIDWIDLAKDRDRWRTVVKRIMNISSPENMGKFLTT
jgi:hypothetical protein